LDELRSRKVRTASAQILATRGGGATRVPGKAAQACLDQLPAVMTLNRYGHLWPDERETSPSAPTGPELPQSRPLRAMGVELDSREDAKPVK
jgi:phenylpropionate dioxygenase-like ring-hydroxylating dioxygenase large terminal subunit